MFTNLSCSLGCDDASLPLLPKSTSSGGGDLGEIVTYYYKSKVSRGAGVLIVHYPAILHTMTRNHPSVPEGVDHYMLYEYIRCFVAHSNTEI